MKHKFTIGAFAIITDSSNRILLCHRNDYDLWNLPGGGLEKNETPWDCAIREVKEETGLIVKINKLLGIYSKPKDDEIVFNFHCNVVGGQLKLTDEASDIKYFSLKNLPQNTSPKQTERIKDFYNQKVQWQKVVMKTQSGKNSLELLNELKSKIISQYDKSRRQPLSI